MVFFIVCLLLLLSVASAIAILFLITIAINNHKDYEDDITKDDWKWD